jgi:Ala-tRNA(Pro) deacylase
LRAYLGVEPGSVTPLALVADKAGDVTFIIERKLLDHTVINVHPLINSRTTALRREDLLTYIRATGHEPTALELPYRTDLAEQGGREPGLQDWPAGPT